MLAESIDFNYARQRNTTHDKAAHGTGGGWIDIIKAKDGVGGSCVVEEGLVEHLGRGLDG